MLPALLLTLLATPVPAGSADQDRGSLEELLRETRKRRAEALARLEAPVAEGIKRLEALGTGGSPTELEKIKGDLVALGPDAAPLIARHLDPGAVAGEAEKALARHVSDVLQALPTSAVTPTLIEIARSGSKTGRIEAIRVLGTSPDVEPASACLADLYLSSKGTMRVVALTSLARLGGAANEKILLDALSEDDPELLKAVLAALTDVGSRGAIQKVRDLAGVPETAAPLVNEILAYLRSCADAVGEDDVRTLVRLAAHDAPEDGDRVAILDAIPDFDPELDSKLKKLFEPLLDSADNTLREATQVCMALLGDRNQRRDLIRRYDDLVDQNDNWAGAYEQRGEVYLRLHEYREAIKDFKRAIKTYESQGRSIKDGIQIDLARAHCLDGNPKQASEVLEDASLSRSALRKLARDPDFRALKDHSRYGKIFDV